MTKLAFKFTGPERGTVIPIKMDRDRWLAIANRNNEMRQIAIRRCWYRHEIEDLYAELHADAA